jgi:dipeptidyl aminopeptidase/acylaminoacyl peptidase
LRKKLGKDAKGNDYILTIPNYGYQLSVQPVRLEAIEVAQPFEPPAASRRIGGQFAWYRGLTGAALVTLVLASLAWTFWPREVVLTVSRQVTRDSRPKFGPLFTDGTRVYFNEMAGARSAIASVPLSGGDVSLLPLPANVSWQVEAISLRRRTLLIRSETAQLFELQLNSLTQQPIPAPDGVPVGWATWDSDGHRYAIGAADTLTLLEPTGTAKPLQLRFPGGVGPAAWNPGSNLVRFSVMDALTGTTSWWDLPETARSARPVSRFSPNPWEQNGTWTNDGRFFVFEAGPQYGPRTQLWITSGDRASTYRLTVDDLSWRGPSIVPGSNVVVAVAGHAQGRLATLPVSGDAASGKPILPGVSAYELDYSRDEKWVTYAAFPEHTIWRSKVDGSEARQLTAAGIEGRQPHWSPDGARIAFMGKESGAGKAWRIYLVPASGGGLEQPLPAGGDQGVPTWSSDGNSLVFGQRRADAGFEGAGIYQLNLATRRTSRIDAPVGMWSPRMSPDGRYLAAVSWDNQSLYLRDNRRGAWRKCATTDLIEEPAWPLDSSFIQFLERSKSGYYGLYRVSPECEQARPVADISAYGFAGGDSWIGITPDHHACGLLKIPDEIYAIEWRLRRRVP